MDRRRRIVAAVLGRAESLPRTGLLFYTRGPNHPIDFNFDEELDWDTELYGYRAPVDDAAVFAAAPYLYDGDASTPLVLSGEELQTLIGALPYNVLFSTTKGLAVYATDADDALLDRAYRYFSRTVLPVPMAGLLLYNKNQFDPTALKFLDSIGTNERTLYPLQYIQADGTGYFLNSDMVTAGRTITSTTKNGTTTLSSPSAGRLNATAGTLWDFTVTWSDAIVSKYRFCSKTAANAGIAYDVSGAGRHLTATGFSNIDTVCVSGREYGSDALNLYGYTTTSFAPIPSRTDNPTLDALGNALTYTGRAKYSIVPKGRTGNCATLASGTSIAITGVTGATVLSKEGTGTVTIGTNVINRATDGTLYNLKLTLSTGRVLTLPLTEGAGTTVWGYDNTGQVYTGTITAADINAFWAGKQTTYFPGLQYGCSIGRWSPLDGIYKDEPTRTNKCACVKANPTETTNIFIGGNASAVLSVVSNPSLIADAGLSNICTSGNVYRANNNNGGSGVAYVIFVGTGSNVDEIVPHSAQIYVAITGGSSSVKLGLSATAGNEFGTITSTVLTHIIGNNIIPTTIANNRLCLTIPLGCQVDFILPQFEKGSTATSLIIGADTAAAATEYNATWPANPYTSGLDCRAHALTAQPLKFNASSGYSLPDSHQARAATGWTYGSANTLYNADGTVKELTFAQLDTAGTGPRYYLGTAGTALYSVDQSATDSLIKSTLQV